MGRVTSGESNLLQWWLVELKPFLIDSSKVLTTLFCITLYVVYYPLCCVSSFRLCITLRLCSVLFLMCWFDLCIIGHIYYVTHVWFCQHAIIVLELLSQSVSVLVNGMNLWDLIDMSFSSPPLAVEPNWERYNKLGYIQSQVPILTCVIAVSRLLMFLPITQNFSTTVLHSGDFFLLMQGLYQDVHMHGVRVHDKL